MPRTVTHKPDSPNNDDVLAASEKWDACKPPYTSAHMKICVAAAKIILAASGVARRSKYEKENYLRIDFSKAGKVTFYAEFPKKMGLKGKKLGEWPELATLRGRSLITEDGEAIEGDALDDVTVIGVVTFTICDVRSDNSII